MNYLDRNPRHDSRFAVHQCVKYSIDPKKSHEEGVIFIGKYLNKTKDKGLIFTTNGSNGL